MTGGIDIGAGPPDTELPPGPDDATRALEAALAEPDERRRDALASVVRAHPAWPDGWAAMAGVSDDDLVAYAYCRVGYHRGLDALRRNGWKGHGPVPWSHAPNQGFLRCLAALARAAEAIGETDEATRCWTFLNDSSGEAYAALAGPPE